MAIARELTTVLAYDVNEAGLNKYISGFEKIKGAALKLTNLMGMTFAIRSLDQMAEQAWEFTKEIVSSGKEMNRLNAQIALLARGSDDVNTITEGIFNTAQKLGAKYGDVAATFKDFLNDSRESKISQQDLLQATENVYASLKVGKASAEETAMALSTIQRGLRRGKINARDMGVLLDVPGISDTLAGALTKGSLEGLRKLAESGKLTGEDIIKAFAKRSEALEKKTANLPMTLAVVWTKIGNELSRASAAISKITGKVSIVGNVIWWVFRRASDAVQWLVRALGGLETTLQLVGIAMAVVVGPLILRSAIMLTSQFVAMAVASWAVWAPWIAIGAAIAAAVLLIHDIYTWMTNPTALTATGRLLGNFEEFKKTIEDIPIVKVFRGFQEMLSGDFTSGLRKITETLTGPGGVTAAIEIVTAAFVTFGALKFLGIISGLGLIKDALLGVKTQAIETKAVVEATNVAPGGKSAAPGTPVVPTQKPNNWPILLGGWSTLLKLPMLLSLWYTSQLKGSTFETPDQQAMSEADRATRYETTRQRLNLPEGTSQADIATAEAARINKEQAGISFWQSLKNYFTPTVAPFTGPGKGRQPLSTIPLVKPDMAVVPQPDVVSTDQRPLLVPSLTPQILVPQAPPPEAPLLSFPELIASLNNLPKVIGTISPETAPLSFGELIGSITDLTKVMGDVTKPSDTVPVLPWDRSVKSQDISTTVNTGGINPVYNITVTAEMNEQQVSSAIQSRLDSTTPQLLERVSRQISDSIPRTERAIQ